MVICNVSRKDEEGRKRRTNSAVTLDSLRLISGGVRTQFGKSPVHSKERGLGTHSVCTSAFPFLGNVSDGRGPFVVDTKSSRWTSRKSSRSEVRNSPQLNSTLYPSRYFVELNTETESCIGFPGEMFGEQALVLPFFCYSFLSLLLDTIAVIYSQRGILYLSYLHPERMCAHVTSGNAFRELILIKS